MKMKKARPVARQALAPAGKLQALRQFLKASFAERDAEIDGLLAALLAREHVLLLGPPGTAKTALAESLTRSIEGLSYFYWLMSRFTVPEELFGTFSIQGLKQDKFVRITRGKLPEASIAFLDEVFKANSAILNALLTLINERKFHNGGAAEDCPLESLIGASNELPESKELDALYDRFLLRYWVSYIKDASALKAVMLSELGSSEAPTLSQEDLAELQAQVVEVGISEDKLDLILEIKRELEKEGIIASDRRWVKVLYLLQAHAALNEHAEIESDDLLLLQHMLWREPKDKAIVYKVVSKLANPAAFEAQEILDAIQEGFDALPTEPGKDGGAEVFTRIAEFNGEIKKAKNRLGNLEPCEAVRTSLERIKSIAGEVARLASKVSGLEL